MTNSGGARWRRAAVLAAGFLAAFGVGLAVGRGSGSPATAASNGTAPTNAATTVAAGNGGPRSVVAGVPVGYSHDQLGASSAASQFAITLAGPLLLHPDQYDAAVTEMAVPGTTSALLAAADQSSTGLEGHLHFQADAKAGSIVSIKTLPLSYHVVSYTDQVAVVSVWLLGVMAADGKQPPFEVWSTGSYTLEWSNGDWRLASPPTATNGPVPVPEGDSSTDPALPDQLKTFSGYTYVAS